MDDDFDVDALREYAQLFRTNFKDTVDHQVDMFTESLISYLRVSGAQGLEIVPNSRSVGDLTLSDEIKRLREENEQLKAELEKSKDYVSTLKNVIALLNVTIAKAQEKK